MPTTIDIRPRPAVAQAGVGLVVVVVFLGIAVGGSVLSVVFGIVFATAIAVRGVQNRVRAEGDRLFVRNFNNRATLEKGEITDFVADDVTGLWKIGGRRRVVDMNLRDGRQLRLTATTRPEPEAADRFAAELNAWLHEPNAQPQAPGA